MWKIVLQKAVVNTEIHSLWSSPDVQANEVDPAEDVVTTNNHA